MGRQTFVLLFIGFLVIQFAGFFTYDMYHRYILSNPGRSEVANRVTQIARIAQVVPRIELENIIQAVNSADLTLTLVDSPNPKAMQLKTFYPHQLHNLIDNFKDNNFEISLHLDIGSWLNIKGSFIQANRLIIFFTVTTLLSMAAASFLLCAWAVRRLAIPLMNFSNAAKRLAIDVNAPSLQAAGPIEIKQAARAFNEMQQQLKQLITNRTQILAAISHDLRTPITKLKLRAEMLEDQTQYEKIIADLNDMESMISATLDFARDDYHDELMERFDLNALLDSICNDLIDIGRDITYHAREERIAYFGRPNALKRVFNNLIENAVKYGKQADVTLIERVDHLIIEIQDQGPGIPENQLEKVFEPFYRIERSRNKDTGGTGLGLAVAREIIRSQGGDIILSNLHEGGLLATITLPNNKTTLDRI